MCLCGGGVTHTQPSYDLVIRLNGSVSNGVELSHFILRFGIFLCVMWFVCFSMINKQKHLN